MQVYEKIRHYIDDHQLDPNAVADHAGIPVSRMNAILNGKRKLYADDLKAICLALGVSVDTFIDP